MDRVLALILAGGRGDRLGVLSYERTKPTIPFAGKYRIIDFTLSNCVNSGIYNVAVLTQYQPLSLAEHIGVGAPWGLAPPGGGGIQLLQPYLDREEDRGWYKGTADAVYQNFQYIEEGGAELVLVLSSDHIYRMDYSDMVKFHQESQADVTLAATTIPYEALGQFGTVVVDEAGQVTRFQEKAKKPESNLISMGIYLFEKEVLRRYLEEDSQLRSSKHDFGRNILPQVVGNCKTMAYSFHDYWRDVGTVQSYWQANVDLLRPESSLLFNIDWPIRTKEELRPPAIFSETASVVNSLISSGCVIEGRVEHSILSPGVKVAEGAVVKDSVILCDSVVGPHTIIDYSILDEEVVVGAGCHIGCGDNFQINRREPKVANTGITLVGKRANIPPGVKVGRNCIIYYGVLEGDFPSSQLLSGETIKARRRGPTRSA